MVSPYAVARSILSDSKNGYGKLYRDVGRYFTGYNLRNQQQASNQVQIDYEQYIKRGNQRAYDDWMRNVGSKGRTIRYPELSYPGQIRRADTSIARNLIDYSIADTNYWSNLPYRTAGLYGISSRLARML